MESNPIVGMEVDKLKGHMYLINLDKDKKGNYKYTKFVKLPDLLNKMDEVKTWKVALILDITARDLTYEKAFKMFTDIVLNDHHYPFRNLKVIYELDKPENR